MRLIDADELIEHVWRDRLDSRERIADLVKSMPSAEPQRMKGRWERHYSRPNVYADLCWHCSNCGYASNDSWANKWKYCPNCGADMRGEQDGRFNQQTGGNKGV